jgi:hypothetical protein
VSCILTSRAEKVKTLCSAEVELAKDLNRDLFVDFALQGDVKAKKQPHPDI